MIIGISLGASQNPETIKPLVVALSFHQMFEGMGLGGCIVQVYFYSLFLLLHGVFFLPKIHICKNGILHGILKDIALLAQIIHVVQLFHRIIVINYFLSVFKIFFF